MNLADLTNYVTVKSQLIETDDQAACQLFLSKRYELIFNSYLWKDALTMVNVPVDPINNLDNANGVVLLPTQIDRLVGIRTPNNSVRIQGLEHFYRIDWDAFCPNPQSFQGFCPSEMSILNPIWFSARPTTPISTTGITYLGSPRPQCLVNVLSGKTYFIIPGANENGIILVNGTQSITLVTGVAVSLVTQGTTLVFEYPNLVGAGAVYDGAGNYFPNVITGKSYNIVWGANEVTFFNIVGTPSSIANPGAGLVSGFIAGSNPEFGAAVAASPVTASVYLVASNVALTAQIYQPCVAGSTISIDSTSPADKGTTPIQLKVTWRDSTDRYTVVGALPMVLTPVDGKGFIEIESVFKPVSQGNIVFTLTNPINPITATVGTLTTSTLQSPSYQRVRIFPIPVAAITLNVLGKKPFIPLTFPTEIPAIRNLDNALIAFAMSDMYCRARFPAEEAAPFMQEGETLLHELALLETIQAAHNSAIEPSSGFGQGVFQSRRGFMSDYY